MDYRDSEKGAYCQETADQETLKNTSNLKLTPASEKPAMEAGDWRTQLPSDSRQRIVNKIMDTLKRHIPCHGEEGLNQIRKVAVRFEEKIYTAANSQSDYLRKISVKMLTMDVKSGELPDLGSQSMQSHFHSRGLSHPIPFSGSHFQIGKQLFQQNIPNDTVSSGVESSAGLPSALPSISGLSHIPIPNVDENPSKQKTSDISLISIGKSIGQDEPSDISPNSSSQIQGQQEVLAKQQPQALQQQLLYQKQLQHALLKKKLQQQQMPPLQSMMPPGFEPITPQMVMQQRQRLQMQLQRQRQRLLHQMQEQHRLQQQYLNQLAKQQSPVMIKTNELPQLHQMDDINDMNMRQGIGVNPGVLQANLPTGQLPDSTAQTGHANGDDWQEEVYQKIKIMKEIYLPELKEIYQKIVAKMKQHDSLAQQPKSEQLEKLKIFKILLERIIVFLSVPKASIVPTFKDKLSLYEKHIINFINANRPRQPGSALQQGQLPPPHMHSMPQPQPQINQTQSHDNQMNPQLQSINLQGSVPTIQANNMTSLQHNSLPSLPGVATEQQTMLNSLQPRSNLDAGQRNALGSMQQAAAGPLQQNPVSSSQHANINILSPQSGLSVLPQNMNPLQSNSNILQHQHIKQQLEQQMLQSQMYKQQFQQCQMQHQYMQQKPQLLQQLQQQQQKQLHQTDDINDVNIRQGIGVNPGVLQANLSTGQLPGYSYEHSKPSAQFLTSSPLLFEAPFVPPTSTLLSPYPTPENSEKSIYGASSLSNNKNISQQQARSECPAPDTPGNGMSTSHLLAGFENANDTHSNALTTDFGKSKVTEQPHDPGVTMAKPMSLKSLEASVVTMVDEAATAVGVDMAAMNKGGLHPRNFFPQTGMTGVEKMRYHMSAFGILAIIIWFIIIVSV